MVVVHVARRGRETGSSSDRVVAGDGLRPMYLHNKRQEENPKSYGCCAAKNHRILLSSSLCVLRAPGDRAPAFAGVPVSSRGRRTPPAPTKLSKVNQLYTKEY
jgi:hypothetical protein